VGLGESTTIRDQPASPDSQPWRFIALKIGVVSAKEEGFQAVIPHPSSLGIDGYRPLRPPPSS
jgi:hypothetical protein